MLYQLKKATEIKNQHRNKGSWLSKKEYLSLDDSLKPLLVKRISENEEDDKILSGEKEEKTKKSSSKQSSSKQQI